MLFIPLVDIIGIKPAPGDHESNFKKVGAIPCGCNTKRATYQLFFVLWEVWHKSCWLRCRIPTLLAAVTSQSASCHTATSRQIPTSCHTATSRQIPASCHTLASCHTSGYTTAAIRIRVATQIGAQEEASWELGWLCGVSTCLSSRDHGRISHLVGWPLGPEIIDNEENIC